MRGQRSKHLKKLQREAANTTTRLETQLELQRNLLATALKDSEKLVKTSKGTQKQRKSWKQNCQIYRGNLLHSVKNTKLPKKLKQTEDLLQSLETGVAISEDITRWNQLRQITPWTPWKDERMQFGFKDSELKLSAIDEELQNQSESG